MQTNKNYFEILKIARDLVVNEHTDRRAELHNKWLVESERLWRTSKLKLPYPPIPPYPTEADIVKRAKMLLDFVESEPVSTPEETPVSLSEETPAAISVETTESTNQTDPADITVPEQQIEANSAVEFAAVSSGAAVQAQANVEIPPRPLFSNSQPLDQIAENALERNRLKLMHEVESESGPTAKAIPSLIQRLEDLRRFWR
jgi:hypothetical protein